ILAVPLCALNQCPTLREVHLNIPYNVLFVYPILYLEFSFILSPTISRYTHFTLGGIRSARLFAIHTIAPISASCGLSHLSLQMPNHKFVQGRRIPFNNNELGTIIETIKQEAASHVTSLSLRLDPRAIRFEVFWSKLVAKFPEIKSLRLENLD